MYIAGFEEMFRAVDARRSQVGVVAAGGEDRTVLEALSQAARRNWIKPIVTGNEAAIRKLAGELRIDVSGFRIVDSDEPAKAAVAEIRDGRAALMMKGQISTPALMKAVLHRETGLRTDRVIGQIVLLEIPRDDRRLLLTDTGITIQPTFDQKADLLRSLIETARLLKDAQTPANSAPRVAVMSATEKPTDSMPDTLEAAELQKRVRPANSPARSCRGPSRSIWPTPRMPRKKRRSPGRWSAMQTRCSFRICSPPT